jgi:hypothetical protein
MFKHLRSRRAARRDATGRTSSPGTGLQVCAHCHADYVHPVDWHEADDAHWWMLLRCGECHREHEVTVGDGVATRFNTDLDAAQREIGRAARSLDEERMADEIEVFAQALQRDLIDAVDFAPRIDQR